MQRISIIMLLSFVALGGNFAAAQDDEKPIQKLFKPIKEFRTRHCNPDPVKGCMCAKCKAKRQKKLCERCIEKAKKAAEKEKEKQQLILDLEKLALELQKLQKEKEDFEEEITWDITDEKESENELLKMAAAAKADQDLAPKKIQALKYVASLGCSKVPDAPKIILAGLKDANANVRAAAVQAILSPYLMPFGSYDGFYTGIGFDSLEDPDAVVEICCPNCKKSRRSTRREKKACDFCKHQDSISAVIDQLTPDCPKKECTEVDPCAECESRRSNKRGKKIQCGFCRGKGCRNCKFKGSVERRADKCVCKVVPASELPGLSDVCDCQLTDVCQACCTEEILEELKEMAFGTTDAGCFYEPNEAVRQLAVQALDMCPGLPPDDVTEEPDVTEESDVTEEPDGDPDVKVELNTDEDGAEATIELDLDDNNGDDSSSYYRGSKRGFARPVSSIRNYDNASGPITHTLGYVDAINSDQTVSIRLDGDFMIPSDYVVEIESFDGTRYEGIVISSKIGSVTIKSTGLPIHVQPGEQLRFGVVASSPEGT